MNTTNSNGNPSPRVKMTYEVQVGDAAEERELPFVIGVLADLEGHATPATRLRDKKFRRVDIDVFDRMIEHIAPVLRFSVPLTIDAAAEQKVDVELRFRSLDDFEPFAVAAQIPFLRELIDVRRRLDDLRSAVHSNDRLDRMIQEILLAGKTGSPDASQPWEREIDQILSLGMMGRLEEEKNWARELLETFFKLVASGDTIAAPDTEAVLTERIGALDEMLSLQLNEVFHHQDFQRLEASWRGLYHLVSTARDYTGVEIEVLPVSKRDLYRDTARAVEFDQSSIFRMVYDERYGTYGGHPFSALIADYEIERTSDDVRFLELMSNVAAASSAPLIAAAAPAMFGLDSFTEMSGPRDLGKIFDATWYARWNAFRASEDSRYTGLVLPRVLMRLPYGRTGNPAEVFNFDERVGRAEHSRYLWGTAVWAFAVRLAEAFHRYGWCAALTGPERGGTVANLPLHQFASDEGDLVTQCPTEIAITDRRRGELEKLGFIPLCYRVGSSLATFFEASSCNKPRLYMHGTDSNVPVTSARLEYMMAVSRFTHYLRCIVRDRLGTFQTAAEWAEYLSRWLTGYVLLHDDSPPETRAKYPLRQASIELQEIPGLPGRYSVLALISPHFQLAARPVGLTFRLDIGVRI